MLLPSEDMNALEKITLENCRNVILEDLDPTLTFLSQLYCARVITEDQKDRVQSHRTRQDKVITLLDILPRRGPKAFRNFIKVLERDYTWIKDILEEEVQSQEYQKKILDAIEERFRQNGEYIRDKDYISKIIRETILPLILQEIRTTPPSSPMTKLDQQLKEIVTNHLMPLAGISPPKNKPEALEISFERAIEIIEELRDKCSHSLGFSTESSSDSSIPAMIGHRMMELKAEINNLKKDSRKSKKLEDKLQAENTKLRTETTNLKAEVKKSKEDSKGIKNDLKKLKDEVHKMKADNSKLKQENNVLQSALDDAGMDLRISSDFCTS